MLSTEYVAKNPYGSDLRMKSTNQ